MCWQTDRGEGMHLYISVLKVSGPTPFVYQLLMTLLVMMLQLVLVMRRQLLVIVVGPWGHGAGSDAGIHVVCSCW